MDIIHRQQNCIIANLLLLFPVPFLGFEGKIRCDIFHPENILSSFHPFTNGDFVPASAY
jgi:hypothetical protein